MILTILFLLSSLPLCAQGPQWIVYNTGNSGLPSNYISYIAVDHNNFVWIATPSGLVKFKNSIWSVYNTSNSGIPSNNVSGISFDSLNNVWISTIDSGAAMFDGTNWNVYDTSNSKIRNNQLSCVYIDPLDVKWFGTGGVSKYDGMNWTNYHALNSNIPSAVILSVTSRNNEIWVSSYNRGIGRLIDTTWTKFTQANSPLPDDYTKVIQKDHQNNIWVGMETGGIAVISENNEWELINSFNSGIPSNSITELLLTPQVKWVGTLAHGAGRLIDTTWTIFNNQNSPIPSFSISGLALDSNGNTWIGTPSGIAVFNENGIVSVRSISNEIPKDFILHQNYPNPFNPSTTITFDISNRSSMQLSIYDNTGKLIKVLLNAEVHPGSHKVIFNSKELSSGIYFYTLKNSLVTISKRMVLLK